MFSRHEPYQTCLEYIEKGYFWTDPPTTLRDLCLVAIEEWDNLDQKYPDELVCHDEYKHESMQEDVLLGIRGTGLC